MRTASRGSYKLHSDDVVWENGNKGVGIVIRNDRGDIMVSAYEKLSSTSCSGGYVF
jgi:hypothetical protein